MKVRYGFVSNSSSGSFIVRLEDITAKQAQQIIYHPTTWKGLDFRWTVSMDQRGLVGSVPIDNFDM